MEFWNNGRRKPQMHGWKTNTQMEEWNDGKKMED